MPARERHIETTRLGGTTGRFVDAPDLSGGSEVLASKSFCGDITGPGDNAPFHVNSEEWSGGVINKPYVGYFSSYFNNYVADICRGPVIDHLGLDDSPSNAEAATRAAARTNPSRPNIDVPVEAFQLAEIVSLIKFRGAGVIRQAASANLEVQFGLKPVLEDLDTLLVLQHLIDVRTQEISRLRSNRGLRRTIGIGSYSANERILLFIQSQNLLLREEFEVSTTETVRVHTRWMPDDISHLAADPALRALATLAVTGATIDSSSVWEAIPWSWLIDYFSNVGDYFRANRNVVGATLNDIAVMRHTVTTASTPAIQGSDFFFEGCTSRKTDKRRATSFVSMSADLHLLDANQVSIVASIAATR